MNIPTGTPKQQIEVYDTNTFYQPLIDLYHSIIDRIQDKISFCPQRNNLENERLADYAEMPAFYVSLSMRKK